ncbi:MAG: hypothetical protein KDD78_07455, partial [Caldilineaceae bacterium]|nr:hypothetical protein [Caldilineaceae bacterium]
SLVSVFELQFESLNARPGTPAQSQVDIFDHADIRAVGIASHGRVEPDNANAQETIYFGVATYADWASPNEIEINIYIDSNRDGADDYRLFNSDAIGYDSASETGDGFVAVVEELATGDVGARQFLNIVSPGDADTALFNSNVMVLPVAPDAIGLADGHSSFLYRVETYSRARREPVDTTPTLAYDMRRVNLDLFHGNSAMPIMEERPGTAITVGYNLQNAQRNGERALLLFHHHNQSGQRVEIIAVRYAWPVEIFVPLVTNARNENR